MSTSLREILRCMSEGWSLHVVPGRGRRSFTGRRLLPVCSLRRSGDERPALAGAVRRLLTLDLAEEVGRDGDRVIYSLSAAGREEIPVAASPPSP